MTDMSNNDSVIAAEEDSEREFVYSISHDMGATLRSIIQFSQLLSVRLSDRLDEKETYWLQLIRENGLKAQKMVDTLLVYSRLSSQKMPDSKLNLHDLLRRVLHTHNDEIEKIKASIVISNRLTDIVGCEEHLFLLLSSLIENALLYQPKDKQHNVKLHISCNQINGMLQICVEDNGIGVPEAYWPRLTLPFKRMQAEEDYPGLGMGLAFCKQITKLHGGALSFGLSSMNGFAVIYREPCRELSSDHP